jgi:hypothetical protein
MNFVLKIFAVLVFFALCAALAIVGELTLDERGGEDDER